MKVVIVRDLLSTFVRFRGDFARQIAELGHRLTVIASCDDADQKSLFQRESISLEIVPMNRTSMNPLTDLRCYRRLKQVTTQIQPDRILAYQAKAAVWPAVAVRAVDQCHVSILFPGLRYLFAPAVNRKHQVLQWIAQLVSVRVSID